MKIIISGGGTGGHIYPAITLIRAVQSLEKNCEVLYVGTKAGLEADIVPKEGIPFTTVEIHGFARRITVENVKTLFKSVKSIIDARKVVRDFQPDIVIGTGGYVCGPVLLAASLMGVPTLIQEQNVIAGITNKILSKFVQKIAVGCQDALKNFPAEKAVYTGNPIRAEVMSAERETGLAAYGLSPDKKTVLISGGSRGARSLNRAMVKVHKHFAGNAKIQLLHVTGKNEYNDIVTRLQKLGIDEENAGNIIIKPYLYDMPKALAAADLAVFRAGATGIAELTARGIPSILVPYPYAAENHQEFNARALVERGAAEMILDRELSAEKLIKAIEGILSDDERLAAMAQASQEMGRPQAAEEIAEMALSLVKR